MDDLKTVLENEIDGEIHFDPIHRRVYSVDASIYEVEPIGIVIPKTEADLIKTAKIAQTFRTPLIARGAATGITGGALGAGLIIDTSKYLNQILEINLSEEYVLCEPGVVQDTLNQALAPYGYRLGPDTSTGNRATLGGMLGNNAAGARSLLYGTMKDHLEGMDLLLANGELISLLPLNSIELAQKKSQKNFEGHLYRELIRIHSEYQEEIEKHFPILPRRASGYNLQALSPLKTLSSTPQFNLSELIAGSEGSLGIATKIRLKIVKKPTHVGLALLYHDNIYKGMHAIPKMAHHHPSAIEMIDSHIIEGGKQAPSMKNKCNWLKGSPQGLFIIELTGESKEEVTAKLNTFIEAMKKESIGYDWSATQDTKQMAEIWELRKAGLGLLLSKRSYSRAIAFLEDLSIPPEKLGSFMEEFRDYLKSKGKEAGIYGHVGAGCMHIRPYIDMRQQKELQLMQQMMLDITDLLLQHNGVLSGEHGDGRIRSWLNPKLFGERLYSAFVEVKAAFDPENRMNPGKVVHGTPLLEHLRINPSTKQNSIDTFLDFSKEGGFELSADMCNGNGACRKAEKIMCPSFQATGDEFHTTRARAQGLRAIVNGRTEKNTLASQELFDLLDLCLECKGCKTECPSEIDMAKFKAETLYHYNKEHGIPLRSRLFAHLGLLCQIGAPFATLLNQLTSHPWSKKILQRLGISPERTLPKLATQRFSHWFSKHKSIHSPQKVVLLNDTYTEFFHPEIGQAAVKLLEKLGYQVILPPWECCGRPAISKGLLPTAQAMAKKLTSLLHPYAKQKLPIIGLEPSCLFALKDDYLSLLGNTHPLQHLIPQLKTLDQFLVEHLTKTNLNDFQNLFKKEKRSFLLHGHCHQKSLLGMETTLQILNSIQQWTTTEIPSGCCGMAGSFGYEKEHYALSMKIGELKLFPSIRHAHTNTIIIADGFSCQGQILHGTNTKTKHLAQALADELLT